MVLIILAVIVAIQAGMAWLAVWAWNLLLAAPFGLPVFGFWHGVAFMVLLSLVGSIFKRK